MRGAVPGLAGEDAGQVSSFKGSIVRFCLSNGTRPIANNVNVNP